MARLHGKRLLFGPLATALVMSMLLSACGDSSPSGNRSDSKGPTGPVSPEWQKVIDKAKEEGSVTWYSGQEADALAEIAKRFEETYGIEVNAQFQIEAAIEAKVDAEHGSKPIADLFSVTDVPYIESKGSAGWFAAPIGPNFSNGSYNADEYVNPHGSFITNGAYWALAWNTQYVPNGLSSYQDLLDPDLKGKIGIIDPAASQSIVDFYFYLEEMEGPEFVRDLAKQDPQIFLSGQEAAKNLISGQISATFTAPSALLPEMDEGAPTDFMTPKPAWGIRLWASILADAPHPNAAQLLADYLVSEVGQEVITFGQASVLPDVDGALLEVDDVRKVDYAKLAPDNVASFRSEFKRLFQ